MSDLVVTQTAPQRTTRRRLLDRGAVSAEYALLTVGTITFGGLLLKILTDEQLRNQLLAILFAIIKLVLSHFGSL
ncbi:MAG: DUF4244 domain-containing protein [Propionibacteriaceae bacterium]|jgi:hypothetical protein